MFCTANFATAMMAAPAVAKYPVKETIAAGRPGIAISDKESPVSELPNTINCLKNAGVGALKRAIASEKKFFMSNLFFEVNG